jgi:hypothetical protein
MELPRFRGHLILGEEGVHDVQISPTLSGRVSSADDRAVHAGRNPSELAREFACSAQTIRNWVAQAAIDAGKPLPGKDGLTSTERKSSRGYAAKCGS